MYLEHFGLKEPPFSIAPDPRYLFMSEGHREALAHLLYGMNGDGGFVLLTGEVGTGKTTVCRCLLERIPQDTRMAFVLHPTLSTEELLATICDEFGICYPEGNRSIKVFIDRINAWLLETHAAGKRAVLIIEEAQDLSTEVLEQLRLLTNLETSRRKLLQIILLGQPELRGLLGRRELLQVAQRITARYHLGPLSKEEAGAYISHRLSVAGCERRLFPPSVTARIFRLSGGIPRVINVLCDRALLGAFVEGKNVVRGATLSRAAREVRDRDASRVRSQVFGWVTAGFLAAVLVAAFVPAYQRFRSPAGTRSAAVSAKGEKYTGNTWHQKADYSPLLFLDPPPAASRNTVDFSLQKLSPVGTDESSDSGKERDLLVKDTGAGPDRAGRMSTTEEKEAKHVIHP